MIIWSISSLVIFSIYFPHSEQQKEEIKTENVSAAGRQMGICYNSWLTSIVTIWHWNYLSRFTAAKSLLKKPDGVKVG